jgi:D-aspartate oxidase
MKNLEAKEIVILGSGIIGLSTANRLIELFENDSNNLNKCLNITIMADKFQQDTTSDGAGGLLRPGEFLIFLINLKAIHITN